MHPWTKFRRSRTFDANPYGVIIDIIAIKRSIMLSAKRSELTKMKWDQTYSILPKIGSLEISSVWPLAPAGSRTFGPNLARLSPDAPGMFRSFAQARVTSAQLLRPSVNEFAGARQSLRSGTAARRRIRSLRSPVPSLRNSPSSAPGAKRARSGLRSGQTVEISL